MVGSMTTTELLTIIRLGLIGSSIAFLIMSEPLVRVRTFIAGHATRLEQYAWAKKKGAESVLGSAGWWCVWYVAHLVGYLPTCPYCVSIEAILVWVWVTGWPATGWGTVLAAVTVSVVSVKAWHP
jgi:hypothetical protein